MFALPLSIQRRFNVILCNCSLLHAALNQSVIKQSHKLCHWRCAHFETFCQQRSRELHTCTQFIIARLCKFWLLLLNAQQSATFWSGKSSLSRVFPHANFTPPSHAISLSCVPGKCKNPLELNVKKCLTSHFCTHLNHDWSKSTNKHIKGRHRRAWGNTFLHSTWHVVGIKSLLRCARH